MTVIQKVWFWREKHHFNFLEMEKSLDGKIEIVFKKDERTQKCILAIEMARSPSLCTLLAVYFGIHDEDVSQFSFVGENNTPVNSTELESGKSYELRVASEEYALKVEYMLFQHPVDPPIRNRHPLLEPHNIAVAKLSEATGKYRLDPEYHDLEDNSYTFNPLVEVVSKIIEDSKAEVEQSKRATRDG